MARHRRSSASARSRRALSQAIESLEGRRYLTQIFGGETFLFKDADGETTAIIARGDIEVNVIGARFTTTAGSDGARLANVPGVIFGRGDTPLLPEGGYGGAGFPGGDDDVQNTLTALYGIWVISNDPNSELIICKIDDDGTPQPYGDSATVAVTTDDDLGLGANSGGVYFGLRTVAPDGGDEDLNDFPVDTMDPDNFVGQVPPAITLPKRAFGPIIDVTGTMGKFLLAGTVTGSAYFRDSVNTFYAGNVLTGDITGGGAGANDNFTIAGDVNNFVVNGYLGTGIVPGDPVDTHYLTGTDLAVGGRIGSIIVTDDFGAAKIDARNGDAKVPIGSSTTELETVVDSNIDDAEKFAFTDQGLIVADVLRNDSFDVPTLIGTGFNNSINKGNTAIVTGSVDLRDGFDDVADYYGIGMLAGQSATITLTSTGLLPANVGVFDPDGRLVATDYSNRTPGGPNTAFKFTADKPGIYRVAVGAIGDVNFNGSDGEDIYVLSLSQYTYSLRVQTAESAIGGLQVGNDIYLDNVDSIRTRFGDIGAVSAGNEIRGSGLLTGGGIITDQGNARALLASTFGHRENGVLGEGVDLFVNGNVGGVRATGADLFLNPSAVDPITQAPVATNAIGGTYQLVDVSGGLFTGYLTANQGIGVVRAADMANLSPNGFFANVDGEGADGFIDLIDVDGDFGTVTAGGPALDAGPGGNIRYVRVGGTAYRDRLFGGGIPDETQLDTARSGTITDDSGARVTFTPLPRFTVANGVTTTIYTAVAITTLPARNGGSVILQVRAGGGLNINSSGSGPAEISDLQLEGTFGAPVTVNATTNALQQLTTISNRYEVRVGGSQRVDIFNVAAAGPLTTLSTNGEIVNASLLSVGDLRAARLGVPRSSSGAAVEGIATAAAALPFNDARNLVGVTGNVLRAYSDEGIGNLQFSGIVGDLRANADGRNVKGVYEGVAAPVVVTGELRAIRIGEGIAPSGTGDYEQSGLFVTGNLGTLRADRNADIRGDIVVSGTPGVISPTTGQVTNVGGISSISLNGGSIVDADITLGNSIDSVLEIRTLPLQATLADPRTLAIGSISVSGGGGVIGSVITGVNLNNLSVSADGFGILNSYFIVQGNGSFGSVSTGGLGIRSSNFNGGASFGSVTANGTGRLLNVRGFSPAVRFSDTQAFDPYSGKALTAENDLNVAIGTSKGRPKVSNLTNEGVIRDTTIAGSRTLGKVKAYQIDASDVSNPGVPAFVSRFSVADRIGSIDVGGSIVGLQVTTGKLDGLGVGRDLASAVITASGTVGKIGIGGSARGSSSISVQGANGYLKQLVVGRNLFSSVVATRIGKVQVGQDIGSSRVRSFGAIDTLSVGNDVLTGAFIRAGGKIGKLVIGGDVQQGATIRATSFSSQEIAGVVSGDLIRG
jgi:hypothetical protein